MSQGFTQPIPIPLPVNKGGTGVTTSTGTGNTVLSISPTITTPNTIGTSTNNNAAAGSVGEYITSNVANASAVSLSPSASIKNITSISLTAGDWDVYGNVFFNVPANTTNILCWTSTTSATSPDASRLSSASNATMGNHGIACPFLRVSIASTTTVYLSAQSAYTGSAPTASGSIYARRVR